MTTKVVHCKKEPYDIYIGRPSIWGNPFIVGRDGTRQEVCNRYRLYLLENHRLMGLLSNLRNKTLGCWCAPEACHGDILAELADKQ
jgi:uncharacterized protein DUF4326